LTEGEIYGGFVASPVQLSSYQADICVEPPAEIQTNTRTPHAAAASSKSMATRTMETTAEDAMPEIVSHSVEFVALPGRTAGIQSEIPLAMRHAFNRTDGFVGCVVLVSEQEARLITVLTLWTGLNRRALCSESEKRLQKWLAPYVDRWLRTRRFASFVAAPEHSLANPHKLRDAPVAINSVHVQ
jgi:hypothetical protein